MPAKKKKTVRTRAQTRAREGTRVVRGQKIYWGLRHRNGRDIQAKRYKGAREGNAAINEIRNYRGCAEAQIVPGYVRCKANARARHGG